MARRRKLFAVVRSAQQYDLPAYRQPGSWFGTWILFFQKQLGIAESQLTSIRGVPPPPARIYPEEMFEELDFSISISVGITSWNMLRLSFLFTWALGTTYDYFGGNPSWTKVFMGLNGQVGK